MDTLHEIGIKTKSKRLGAYSRILSFLLKGKKGNKKRKNSEVR